MFRKRKEPDGVEGYNRISRLVAERQRELTEGGPADDALDDDTIVMPAASGDEREGQESVSLIGLRGGASTSASVQPLPTGPSSQHETEEAGGAPASPVDEREERDDVPEAAPSAEASSWDLPYDAITPPDPMPQPSIAASAGHASLVAAAAVWEGKLRSDGDIRIEGVLRGEIETAETLVVAPQARVHGTVRARNVTLGGDVEGEITCEERLEILPGGSARGQINSGTLVVHEGAYIDSRFQMRRE